MSLRRFRQVVEEMLDEGEELLVTASATQTDAPGLFASISGALSVTTARLVFASKDDVESIPFAAVSLVELRERLMTKSVAVHTRDSVRTYLVKFREAVELVNVAEAQRVLASQPRIVNSPAEAGTRADPPLVCVVGQGSEIELGVNKQHATAAAVKYLLGRPDEDGDISREVPLWMWRDLTSQFDDSVRVETPTGELVGWVLKADSPLACDVVDQISDAVPKSEPRASGRRLILEVTAEVEGYWEFEDEPELLSVMLQIKEPAEVELRDDD